MNETTELSEQKSSSNQEPNQWPIFVKKLVIYIATILLFFLIIFIILRMYTRHGENINVPELRKLTIEEVKKECDARGLRYYINDSVYGTNQKPGSVVDQTPPANFKVKKDRTIFLTIKAYAAEQVSMPQLVGVSMVQAQADLGTIGLSVGKITKKIQQGYNKGGFILEQLFDGKNIPAGTKIPKGSKIDIVIAESEEGATKTSVPSLKSYSLYTANLVAAQNSLNIGLIIGDNTIHSQEDSLSAVIYKQSPAPDRVVTTGSDIDVWITTDKNKADDDIIESQDNNLNIDDINVDEF
ncbi:MAG: PASTA domain-containing protein [Bacteroidales bacterium]|nr:PASTA domain-containing protein [Bacteroidales bacterium]